MSGPATLLLGGTLTVRFDMQKLMLLMVENVSGSDYRCITEPSFPVIKGNRTVFVNTVD